MKSSLRAVTTTHLIKYNTVKQNGLHTSKYNEMNTTCFFFLVFFVVVVVENSSLKAETAKHKREKNNMSYKSVDAWYAWYWISNTFPSP